MTKSADTDGGSRVVSAVLASMLLLLARSPPLDSPHTNVKPNQMLPLTKTMEQNKERKKK